MKVFFETPDIKITSKRALFFNQYTVDIQKVDAVFVTRQSTYFFNYFCSGWVIMGIYALCDVILFAIAGFALVAYAVFSLFKPKYALRIKTGVGEIRPIITRDKVMLKEIQNAINSAIVYINDEHDDE